MFKLASNKSVSDIMASFNTTLSNLDAVVDRADKGIEANNKRIQELKAAYEQNVADLEADNELLLDERSRAQRAAEGINALINGNT